VYVSPPTFVTGNILHAGHLNILADDIEYINSLTDFINIPFFQYVYGVGGAQDMTTQKWMLRHRHRYLHYWFTIDTENITNQLYIYADIGGGPIVIYTHVGGQEAPLTVAGYIDLNPFGFASLAWMSVYWGGVAEGLATNHYFFESSFTSL